MVNEIDIVVLSSILMDIIMIVLFAYNLLKFSKAKYVIKDHFTKKLITSIFGLLIAFVFSLLNLRLISVNAELQNIISTDIVEFVSIVLALLTNLTLLYIAFTMYRESSEIGFEVD